MRVSSTLAERHSENDFADNLRILSDSGAGVIHVRSSEVVRATLACRKAILVDGNTCKEWDVANGFREFDVSNMFKMNVSGDNNTDIHGCMAQPGSHITDADEEVYSYFVFVNPQYWMDNNPILVHHIQQYCHILASTNVRVVLITPDIPLPDPLNDSVVTLHFDPPSHAELRSYLEGVFAGVDDEVLEVDGEELDKICYAGAGMSREAFEMYTSLAIVKSATDEARVDEAVSSEDIITGLNQGKTEVVNKNDILELYPTEAIEDVGGMENLKEWVNKRSDCYSDEAREFGIEAPKGIVLVGIPGTGKSLVAKAIASELGVPLVRLDFGRVFNSLVGKSEERMRVALKMVESMAPCCTGDTMVDLADGTKESLLRLYENRNGEDIYIRTVDPNSGIKATGVMKGVLRKPGKGKGLVKVTTEKGEVKVTPDHKLLVYSNESLSWEWKEAKNLKIGDDIREV